MIIIGCGFRGIYHMIWRINFKSLCRSRKLPRYSYSVISFKSRIEQFFSLQIFPTNYKKHAYFDDDLCKVLVLVSFACCLAVSWWKAMLSLNQVVFLLFLYVYFSLAIHVKSPAIFSNCAKITNFVPLLICSPLFCSLSLKVAHFHGKHHPNLVHGSWLLKY